jgi:hypothetical protein
VSQPEMKIFPLLILIIVAAILFSIGLYIPGRPTISHYIFLIAGAILGFIFYLITFIHVIKTPTLNSAKRMFWIVAIICVPVIGNVIYLLLQSAFTKKQIPKPENW